MTGVKSARRRAALRFNRLFEMASRNFDERMRAIVASQAAKGLLQSGATIRAAVRAASDVTNEAVIEALAGISRATEHVGRKRDAMLDALAEALEVHHVAIKAEVEAALGKVGLGNDVRHADPHFAAEAARHRELVEDFKEGWTAPAGKRWNERHPLLFAITTVIIGIGLGWVAKSLIGDQWQSGRSRESGGFERGSAVSNLDENPSSHLAARQHSKEARDALSKCSQPASDQAAGDNGCSTRAVKATFDQKVTRKP